MLRHSAAQKNSRLAKNRDTKTGISASTLLDPDGHLPVPVLVFRRDNGVAICPFHSSSAGSAIYSDLIPDCRLSCLADELGAVDTGDAGDGGDHHAGEELHGGYVAVVKRSGRR